MSLLVTNKYLATQASGFFYIKLFTTCLWECVWVCTCGCRQLQSLRPDPATVTWAVFTYMSSLIRTNLVSDGRMFRLEAWRTGPGWWQKAVALHCHWGQTVGTHPRLRWGPALKISTWSLSPCSQVNTGHPDPSRENNSFAKKPVKNDT